MVDRRQLFCCLITRYDLDQSTFSPPSEDDSFFYIRYPKSKAVDPPPLKSSSTAATPGQPNYRSINEVLQNHTGPCRQFIPQAQTSNVLFIFFCFFFLQKLSIFEVCIFNLLIFFYKNIFYLFC